MLDKHSFGNNRRNIFNCSGIRSLRLSVSLFRAALLITFLIAPKTYALDLPDIEVHTEKRSGKVVGIVNKSASKEVRPRAMKRQPASSSLEETSLAIQSADKFLSEKGRLFGIENVASDIHPLSVNEDLVGHKVLRYSQRKNGIPVYGGDLAVQLNSNFEVKSVFGRTLDTRNVTTIPKIKAKAAARRAVRNIERRPGSKLAFSIARRGIKKECRAGRNPANCYRKRIRKIRRFKTHYAVGTPQLLIYNANFLDNLEGGDTLLVWRVFVKNDFDNAEEIIVDSLHGAIVSFRSTSNHATTRRIYDCSDPLDTHFCYANFGPGADGYPVQYAPHVFGRREGDPPNGPNPVPGPTFGSTDVDVAYDMIPSIHSFYEERFLRNGANNKGGMGDGTCPTCSGVALTETRVHSNINNTLPSYLLDFCDDGGSSFQHYPSSSAMRFCSGSVAHDIMGHEYGHALARYVSFNEDGTYNSVLGSSRSETGALNESNSDILGVSFQYWIQGESGPIDWTIGNDSLHDQRNLSDPSSTTFFDGETKPHPDNFNSPNYTCASIDNFGVHANSTVPSYAAYLAAAGGSFNGCQIQGIGIHKVQQIWYTALTSYFTASTSFNQAYAAINEACQSLSNPPFTIPSVTPPVTIVPDDCKQLKKAMEAVEMDLPGGCLGPSLPANYDFTPSCTLPHTNFSADFNRNDIVDLGDWNILRGRWNYPNFPGPIHNAPPEADANGDGEVNMIDYQVWARQFEEDFPEMDVRPAPTLVGDYNFDRVVDYEDYLFWTFDFGRRDAGLWADQDSNFIVDHRDLLLWSKSFPGQIGGDYNNDGIVDLWDYNTLYQQWWDNSGASLSADINKDGIVDIIDYEVWADVYNLAPLPAAPTVRGDYNGDGAVDDADYLKWKDNFGQTGPALSADGNGDGVVDAADYTVWRDSRGQN